VAGSEAQTLAASAEPNAKDHFDGFRDEAGACKVMLTS
jgi:hypothetical protein